MKKTVISCLALFAFLIFSCSKSSEDTVDPGPGPGTCDTVNMKYQANVVPILTANCYSCHGSATNSGSNGIILEGHANLKAKAESGTLIGVITHASGYPAMPMNGVKLSDCNINKIRSWINNGMQDN